MANYHYATGHLLAGHWVMREAWPQPETETNDKGELVWWPNCVSLQNGKMILQWNKQDFSFLPTKEDKLAMDWIMV